MVSVLELGQLSGQYLDTCPVCSLEVGSLFGQTVTVLGLRTVEGTTETLILQHKQQHGMTTINVSWKPYVRHVWLYGFFEDHTKTIHKTISEMTSFGSRSTTNIS